MRVYIRDRIVYNRVTIKMDSLDSLFEKPEYFPEIDRFRDVGIQPDYAPTDNNNIEFTIGSFNETAATILSGPAAPSLSGYVRVLNEDGTELKENEYVAPCNLFPHALFSRVGVELNYKPISDSGRYYHLKSYLSNYFSYGSGAKALTLRSDCYVPDDDSDPVMITKDGPGLQFASRSVEIAKSKKFYFSVKPIFDLSSSALPLAPGMHLKLIFERNDTSIPLMSPLTNASYRISYHDLKLNVRQFTPDPASSALKRLNAGHTAYYPINRVVCNTRQVTFGSSSVTIPNIANGQLPYHVMAVLLTNEQLKSIAANPYIFQSHNLRAFKLIRRGQSYPESCLEIKGNPTRAYKFFLENMGINVCLGDAGTSQKSYFSKDFVMAWDLSLHSCCGLHNHNPLDGGIDIHLEFAEPTTYPLNLFYMLMYENVVSVSGTEVAKDFTC